MTTGAKLNDAANSCKISDQISTQSCLSLASRELRSLNAALCPHKPAHSRLKTISFHDIITPKKRVVISYVHV